MFQMENNQKYLTVFTSFLKCDFFIQIVDFLTKYFFCYLFFVRLISLSVCVYVKFMLLAAFNIPKENLSALKQSLNDIDRYSLANYFYIHKIIHKKLSEKKIEIQSNRINASLHQLKGFLVKWYTNFYESIEISHQH